MMCCRQVGLAIALLACVSCASLNAPVNTEPLSADCPAVMQVSAAKTRLPVAEVISDPALGGVYSRSSLLVANAYGLVDHLRALEALRAKMRAAPGDDRLRLDLIYLERRIDTQMDIAPMELEALSDSVDCEGYQVSKNYSRLAKVNQSQDEKLTTAAIVTGALSSALVAAILVSEDKALKEGDAKDWIGVAGGAVATYLAIRARQVNHTVILSHKRNLVQAVWENDNSAETFPDAPWYLLTEPGVIDADNLSLRQSVVQDWLDSPTMLGNEEKLARLSVLLEATGTYDETMLLLRSEMLEGIETAIDSLTLGILRLHHEMAIGLGD